MLFLFPLVSLSLSAYGIARQESSAPWVAPLIMLPYALYFAPETLALLIPLLQWIIPVLLACRKPNLALLTLSVCIAHTVVLIYLLALFHQLSVVSSSWGP